MNIFKNLVLLSILSILISCSKEDKKIGFLFPNMVSGRYIKEKEAFIKRVKELGGTPLVMTADYDDNLQIKQANELISQGAKVLVVNPINGNTAAAIIREAHKNNVKVIAYDRLVKNCDLDYFISFDNEKVGRLMAEYVLRTKPEGNYILLGGDKSDQNAIWVKNGQTTALAPYIASGKIKVIYNVFVEDWSGENAKFEMKTFFNLSPENPDVILSSYDGMTTSAIEVLKEQGLQGKVLITGQDAELDACRNIVKGNQVMTIYKPVNNLAIKAAELAYNIALGQKIETNAKTPNGEKDVPSVFLEPIVVDKDNIKSKIIADGFHSEKEIFE
jgi:D-xylose transport system substrate-binding protein